MKLLKDTALSVSRAPRRAGATADWDRATEVTSIFSNQFPQSQFAPPPDPEANRPRFRLILEHDMTHVRLILEHDMTHVHAGGSSKLRCVLGRLGRERKVRCCHAGAVGLAHSLSREREPTASCLRFVLL